MYGWCRIQKGTRFKPNIEQKWTHWELNPTPLAYHTMLSKRDNQLHHVPYIISIYGIINLSEYYLLRDFHVKHPREIFFKQYVSKAKAPASKFEI